MLRIVTFVWVTLQKGRMVRCMQCRLKQYVGLICTGNTKTTEKKITVMFFCWRIRFMALGGLDKSNDLDWWQVGAVMIDPTRPQPKALSVQPKQTSQVMPTIVSSCIQSELRLQHQHWRPSLQENSLYNNYNNTAKLKDAITQGVIQGKHFCTSLGFPLQFNV